MLDVHPPHEATHTWQDFFIHIATIIIGLLIAIGLEQTVELLHHRHEREDARERLIEEIKDNAEVTRDNVYALHAHEKHLAEDLQVLARLRAHKLQPTDHIITDRPWTPVKVGAWTTARADGAAAYLSPDDQVIFEHTNRDADLFNTMSLEAQTTLGRGAMVINQTRLLKAAPPQADASDIYYGHRGDAAAEEFSLAGAVGAVTLSQLTPAQIDRLKQTLVKSPISRKIKAG